MMNQENQDWIARQENSPEARRDYEYERLLVSVLDEISAAMERNQLSKADLARLLKTSRANITQILSGERNVTLRTISDLAWACGVRLCAKTQPLRDGDFISSPALVVEPRRRMLEVKPVQPWQGSSDTSGHKLVARYVR